MVRHGRPVISLFLAPLGVCETNIRCVPINTKEENGKESTIDPGIEAIIQGIQASGAVGVRSLQLARQLLQFSPEIEARLSQAFDSNPGLPKLLFWENLRNFIVRADRGDVLYQEPARFARERLVAIKGKAGGGSLYTTYAAVVRDEGGQPTESVVKMLNPNPGLIIESFYSVALDTLEEVKKTGSPEDIRNAEKALMIITMAQQWCLNDINDPTFETDDTMFKDIIAAFNEKIGGNILYSPDRLFTSYLVKSETFAMGRTVNKILNDDAVPFEQKREIIKTKTDFFEYQLSHPSRAGTYLVLSDPSPGNSMVTNGSEGMQIGIIDRNMFLSLSPTEAKAIRELWQGNQETFFRTFVESIFSVNKVRIPWRKLKIGKGLESIVRRELEDTREQNNVDTLHLMHSVIEELQRQNLEVPLRMHLAIKNVFALKELQRRYQV